MPHLESPYLLFSFDQILPHSFLSQLNKAELSIIEQSKKNMKTEDNRGGQGKHKERSMRGHSN